MVTLLKKFHHLFFDARHAKKKTERSNLEVTFRYSFCHPNIQFYALAIVYVGFSMGDSFCSFFFFVGIILMQLLPLEALAGVFFFFVAWSSFFAPVTICVNYAKILLSCVFLCVSRSIFLFNVIFIASSTFQPFSHHTNKPATRHVHAADLLLSMIELNMYTIFFVHSHWCANSHWCAHI